MAPGALWTWGYSALGRLGRGTLSVLVSPGPGTLVGGGGGLWPVEGSGFGAGWVEARSFDMRTYLPLGRPGDFTLDVFT